MIRRILASALALVIAASAIAVAPANAAAPLGAVTWTVDHQKKTITVLVRIQIYSACSGNPYGDPDEKAAACRGVRSQVSQFLADKIKHNAEAFWNKGYNYKCYKLILIVDVKLAPDRDHVDPDRLGVRIDPSLVSIRSWVDVGSTNDQSKWGSNDPADRVVPENGSRETTWTEGAQNGAGWDTYAHEVGHMIGLHDGYKDVVDPNTGKTTSVPRDGAPVDLMSTGYKISQETIDRVVERNRDQLIDTKGNKVDLEDLVCDLLFAAHFKAGEEDYHASNLMNSAPVSCHLEPITASERQTDKVLGDKVEIQLVETADVHPLGYVLVPTFDVLTVQNGMSGGGRANAAIGLFDIPVKVDLVRTNSKPATGDIPQVLDFNDRTCPGGSAGGSPTPKDCGSRTYRAWLAMSIRGADQVWPVGSSLPNILQGLGYDSPRVDRLYKNCAGQSARPGFFVDDTGVQMVRGKLPPLATIKKVAVDWYNDGVSGKVVIEGTADLDRSEVGNLIKNYMEWTLTLCPLNKAGEAPSDCP